MALVLVTAWASFTPGASQAQEADAAPFRLVVHADHPVKAIPIPEVSDLFLGKTPAWPDGQKVVVVRRESDDPIRREFDRRIHSLPTSQVNQVWTRRLVTGRAARTEQATSDAEVLRIVRSQPGAIGYVGAGTSLEGVQELPFVELPEREAYRPPEYPPMAKRARFYGVVILRVHLDVEGNVDEVEVVEGQRMGLTEAAVEAVSQWRYAPSEYRGRPVEVTFKVAVRFQS